MTTKKIIFYTASWCSPCAMIKDLLDKFNADKSVEVIEVDVDKCPQLGLSSVPKVCLIDDDNKVLKCLDGGSTENNDEIVKFIRGK